MTLRGRELQGCAAEARGAAGELKEEEEGGRCRSRAKEEEEMEEEGGWRRAKWMKEMKRRR